MWTTENRSRYGRRGLRYPSDVTDAEWALIAGMIPPAKRGGNARTVNLREVVNGHVLVDTLGLMLHAVVHSAGLQDRDGSVLVMATLFGMFPFLRKLYADAGYQGPKFQAALKRVLRQVQIETVRHADTAQGFEVLPRRWVVERTIAWLNRCRRLAKDWENLSRTALAFLRLASIRLMMRRLCQP